MLHIDPSQLPNKIRLCLLDQKNGRPVRGVPVELMIEVNSSNHGTLTVSVGLLASNHAGYLAFNLTEKKKKLYDRVNTIHAVIPIEPRVCIDLTDKLTHPFISGSKQPGQPQSQEIIPISLPSELGDLRATSLGLNSVENPDIADWLLSPGSFGADAVPIIGEDGCEVLLPSHAAERVIRFHQLFRTSPPAGLLTIPFDAAPSYSQENLSPEEGWPEEIYARTGELHHYELVWLPINHGLGKVLYSLTLAPCEAVRIAVVDWSRSEEAARNEDVTLSDSLTHSLRRDRSVEEIVNAVLREHQSGDSFLGGMAGVGGYGGGFGGGGMGMPTGGSNASGTGALSGGESSSGNQGGRQQSGQNWGVTGSHSLGYAMANSSGSRDVDVETTQNLVDEIAQASHLIRDLRSTVIVQANQAEREAVQTRIVRNHNHSHALTVLYYEVVRHYLVRALHRRVQPVIFIKYPVLVFDDATAYKHRHLLADKLLKPYLASYFDELAQSLVASNNDLEYFNNGRITEFIVTVTASGDAIDNLDRLYFQILSAGRATVLDLRFPAGIVRDFTTRTFSLSNTDLTLRYRDILQLGLLYSVEGDGEARERSSVQGFDVKAVIVNRGTPKIFDLLTSTTYYKFENTSTFWQIPNRKLDAAALSVHDAERRRKIEELLSHLVENRHHYSAIIWLRESPHERATRFEHYQLDGAPLIERINNHPIDVVGDYLIFPLAESSSDQALENDEIEVIAERIVSLPTRGAFAEAKLSHCNASEIIDDTRFWDWQISPCPDVPTEIAPITLGSRRSVTDVTPTTLPESGIGITEPQLAPEPFGMREVMQLLRTPDIFRNMSGIEELGSLLEKLVEVAGEVEKARIGATTTLATAGRDTSSLSESPRVAPRGTDSVSAATSGETDISPQTVSRQIANAERAIERVEDPELRQTLRQENAERAVDAVGENRSAPVRRRSEPRTMRLTFAFQDHRGVPVPGDYDVAVRSTQEDVAPWFGSTTNDSLINFHVPRSWQSVQIDFTIRNAHIPVLGRGDFSQLQQLFEGISSRIIGSDEHLFSGITRQLLAELDPTTLASYNFDVEFATRTRTINVAGEGELQAQVEGNLTAGVAEILRLGEIGGSVGGSAGGSISTQFELKILTGGVNIRQHAR